MNVPSGSGADVTSFFTTPKARHPGSCGDREDECGDTFLFNGRCVVEADTRYDHINSRLDPNIAISAYSSLSKILDFIYLNFTQLVNNATSN